MRILASVFLKYPLGKRNEELFTRKLGAALNVEVFVREPTHIYLRPEPDADECGLTQTSITHMAQEVRRILGEIGYTEEAIAQAKLSIEVSGIAV